jgi:Tfp pilus assembly protein PilN
MPLHINLYHEVQRQELARQRDPLRLGMLAVLIIAIGFVGNYFVVLERAHSVDVRYADLQGTWAALEPKATDAKNRQEELNAEIQASDAMIATVDGRYYWAPVFDQVLKTVPRTVQLTHMGGSAPPDEKGTTSVLSISGIASAVEPRKEAEALRTSLVVKLGSQFKHVTSVFRSLEDSDQYVMLDGRRLPTASFTIDIQIQVREAEVVAAPPPRRARAAAAAATE